MSFLFNGGAHQLLSGGIDWENDTIKARLVATSELPDQDAIAMTGIGIAATDQALGGKAGPTKNDSDDRIEYRAGDPTFPAVEAGPAINQMAIYKFVTDDSDSSPIALVDLSEVTPNGGAIAVTFDAAGAFYLQQ